MSLKIRMARGGMRNQPFYRIVVADSRSPRDGRFIEKVGHYNPMLPREHKERVVIDLERCKYWMGVGALPSDRVTRFLADAGVMEKPKHRETPKKSAPRAKRVEREKAAAGKPAEGEKKPEEQKAG
ncbi:MAG: 30S ribosomal protein S16 [Alphaproteobacteria bacterium]|nr:30S ribosomal protein S16 [Alphaproteobacteria bacterium]